MVERWNIVAPLNWASDRHINEGYIATNSHYFDNLFVAYNRRDTAIENDWASQSDVVLLCFASCDIMISRSASHIRLDTNQQ